MDWLPSFQTIIADSIAHIVGGAALGAVGTMLGVLLFGRHYKRRIAALEVEARTSAITQTFNFYGGATGEERERHLRGAVDAATTRGIKEAIGRLPRTPLVGGHAYVSLPDGTNIVLMSDGTMRLALPVSLSASFGGGLDGSVSGEVRLGDTEKSDDR